MEDKKELILQMNEDGVWGIKPDPYATIECPTEEDFNKLIEMTEKYHAEKPIQDAPCTFRCSRCKSYLFEEVVRMRSNYCPDCGQKIDWTDIN